MTVRMAVRLSAKLSEVRPKAPDRILVTGCAGGGV
jgi:hypothetical protein